ncbi:sulfatase [Planctomycetes bacterium K23_9]|uniref:Sulfatase n=1 Tax=Stieleria marina TaxID=1930275 RepID=A0A517NQT0_9BACT|nr:Sulfatase [Planctomycetes bacterium K23_9]
MNPLLRTGLCVLLLTSSAIAADRPNILWITSEDNGPQLGCYGDEYADTPNLDALAQKSLRYKMCWSNAPVCAPARTTLISGMHATSLGGHHMRSGVKLPADLKLYPQVLKEAGYYCTNNSKTDYNFANGDVDWDQSSKKAHWRDRPSKQTPFFSIFNITISHESKIRSKPHTLIHDPANARVPAYQPDVYEVRRDWAQYYDKMTEMDAQVGKVLKQLDKDGLADSTIVFYYGDHGSGMPRSKRWPFNSGLHVPFILHVPAKFKDLAPADYQSGAMSNRLTSFVDMGPTAISLAGVKPPTNMQGVPFAGKFSGKSKSYLFGYRGRMDERIDMVRSCTDGRYVYMKHFYPHRPYLKYVDYMFQTTTTRLWKEMFDAGKLNDAQAKVWKTKPTEELFDLESDPDETINLATKPEHAERVATMRQAVRDWMIDTRDMGVFPEAEMHRRSGSLSPLEYARSGEVPFEQIVDAAMGTNISLDDRDSVVRFWSVKNAPSDIQRLLHSYGPNHPQVKAMEAEKAARLKLMAADESPSVAIAACDELLLAKLEQKFATNRLIELANVNDYGHYAAIEALNVLDMNADLNDAVTAAIKTLPRQAAKPPVRLGKYVGHLINHATKAPAK